MTRQALVALTVALAAGLGMSSVFSQTPPNTTQLQPAPDIPGVIKGGTMPEVVIQGLTSSDDSFWLPNVGIIFSEPRANRIVRLDEHDQPVTFVGNLHGPLGMAFDAKNGRLVSLQTEPGFTGPRVVWPAGKEAILANNYQGKPFGRPNDIVADRNGAPAGAPPRSNADGLVTDDDGRLYSLTESGIEVLSPTGQHLGVIPLWCITRRCQNLGFGGPDKRTLYVAGGGTLLRIPMLARGFQGRAK